MNARTFLCTAVATLSLACPLAASASGNPFEDILVQYDFNCGGKSTPPSFVSSCVCASDLTFERLCVQSLSGGRDGSMFQSFSGWDTSYDYSFARTDFSSPPGTFSYDVFVKPGSLSEITGVSFDWMRPGSSSVDAIQATIFWEDSAGVIQYSSTGPIALDDVGVWNSRRLDFPIDVAPLPTGTDVSGKQFHLEFYAWGGNGGALNLDNVTLNGNCAPIPEPGGALLIAAAGVALLLRRRSRA